MVQQIRLLGSETQLLFNLDAIMVLNISVDVGQELPPEASEWDAEDVVQPITDELARNLWWWAR